MPTPRFGTPIVLDVQRDSEGRYTAVLEQAGPAADTLAGTTPCRTEAFALRQLAQRVVVLPMLYPDRIKADELLERMSESDRAKFAPHLRQSAQDIAEMMAATVGRIDALMAAPATEGR